MNCHSYLSTDIEWGGNFVHNSVVELSIFSDIQEG